ncbi:FmdB family zinc ribbon protein [Acidisoma cladoniae]|jgi:putative FmdB family regulatory protein|uniref:FmdB family zinc ribbon protein n=1 Tax=Acidisoma cladoniae TaxID=3040935 RepID=UPI00254C5276|nr:FmdB family zinc ribbon protein [Acidisoma sp. PAMC 29798]
MPLYDYDCARCGTFTEFAGMAAFAAPRDCPTCGTATPRNLIASPSLRGAAVTVMPGRKPGTPSRHAGSCGCCGPAPRGLRAAAVSPR